MTPALHHVNDIETVTYRWLWRDCDECDRPAKFRITFLFANSRRNPASKGYGKDDISWCADAERFACGLHEYVVSRRSQENGLSWCSSFPLVRYQHMGWYRKQVKP